MPKRLPAKESEKARTNLSDCFFLNEDLTKKLKQLIHATAMNLPAARSDMFKAAAAVRDATQVLICKETEAMVEEQRAKIFEMRKAEIAAKH